MTVRTSAPARARTTASELSARARNSSSPIDGATSSRSRTLPETWTTQVTVSSTSSAGSAVGHVDACTESPASTSWPSLDQISSAVYGAKQLSIVASAVTPSRSELGAGLDPSMPLRSALVSSISRAIATFSRCVSSSLVTSSTVCATARSIVSSRASVDGSAATSAASRATRASHFTDPDGDTSAQSMSSSGGPAKTMEMRMASTPNDASWPPRSTPLPSDLLMALPWLMTWPWFSSAENGSTKSTIPMSYSTLVKNRLYSRCRIACSTPPTYCATGVHSRTASSSNGPFSYDGEQ